MIKGTKEQYSEKKIIEALKMIKDICSHQEECEICPFFNEDYQDCNFNIYEPTSWNFKKTEVWRAFAQKPEEWED